MLVLKCAALIGAGAIAAVVALVALLLFLPLRPFETAIATAFDGRTDLGPDAKYVVVCAGFDCDDLVPRLPPVSAVDCSQSMVSDNLKPYGYDIHIMGLGACCVAQFGNLGSAEVHIYRQLLTYKILLTEPRMRDIATAIAQQPPSG